MLGLDRRRRSRRRNIWPVVAVIAGVVVVLVLLIGGLAKIGPASGPFHRSINRSYGTEADAIVAQSNQTGASLRTLLGEVSSPQLTRTGLEVTLGTLAADAAREAVLVADLAPPDPSADAAPQLDAVLTARASAVVDLERAFDGFLGLSSSLDSGHVPAPLSAGGFTDDLTGVGAALERADAQYASARRALRRASGNARLHASRWVTNAALWSPGTIATLSSLLTASPTLHVDHDVELAPSGVRIDPPAVPSVPGAAPGSLLPPTTSLLVTAVVLNAGNVYESGVTVTASVDETGRPATIRTETVRLAPGRSIAVQFPAFRVAPGSVYALTVAVIPSPAQLARSGLSDSYFLRISPATSTSPPI